MINIDKLAFDVLDAGGGQFDKKCLEEIADRHNLTFNERSLLEQAVYEFYEETTGDDNE